MQSTPSEDQKNQTIFTPLEPSASGSQQPVDKTMNTALSENQPSSFYTQDQNDEPDFHFPLAEEHDDQANPSSPFVLPFQNSAAMPTIAKTNAQRGDQGAMGAFSPSVPSTGKPRRASLRVVKILLIVAVVLITIIGASFFVFAQSPTSPGTTPVNGTQTNGTTSPLPASKPTPAPATKPSTSSTGSPAKTTSNPPSQQNQGQGTPATSSLPASSIPSTQLLNQIGWIQAGLSFGDAIEVLRTATTFTDREMSFDYRNIGTITTHGGTLTGSLFLLTPGGKVRFVQNDVRMINNVLYNKIRTGKMIQQAMNEQPSLVQFQMISVQGMQQKIAWVNVAFEVFQSKLDPVSGKRTESLELDATTGQPMLHHLTVVLLRVSPQNQGVNAPMGGTGWLVNTYELDTKTLPPLATTPSL